MYNHQLDTFIVVADSGSFNKAAEALFISPPAVIKQINLLEESHVDFRCIDFPWFCKENLPLIKAVVLYEKLEIRINV